MRVDSCDLVPQHGEVLANFNCINALLPPKLGGVDDDVIDFTHVYARSKTHKTAALLLTVVTQQGRKWRRTVHCIAAGNGVAIAASGLFLAGISMHSSASFYSFFVNYLAFSLQSLITMVIIANMKLFQ